MPLDYSKIFAQSATSQSEWGDSDYIRGWLSKGTAPPTVEDFDALQRNTDLKLKDLDERLQAAGENGSTTINDSVVPTANATTINTALDGIANRIKTITGKSDWKAAPSINLENVNLRALGGLTGAANSLPTFTSASTMGVITMSTIGKNLLQATSAANARSEIGAASTSAATQSANGLMSATDKTKLDGIAANANNYSLPTATSYVLGGVKTGSNITNSSGTISITGANVKAALGTGSGTTKYLREDGNWVAPPITTYNDFVKSGATAAHGLVPAPPTTEGSTKYLREDGTWSVPPNTTYNNATQSVAGLMSSGDKQKLDGIANNANNYTLPAATGSTLGGVKIGSNISNSSGTISVPVVSASSNGVMTPAMFAMLGAGAYKAPTSYTALIDWNTMNTLAGSDVRNIRNTDTGIIAYGGDSDMPHPSGGETHGDLYLKQSYKNFDAILVAGTNDAGTFNWYALWPTWLLKYNFDNCYMFNLSLYTTYDYWRVMGTARHGTATNYRLSTDTYWSGNGTDESQNAGIIEIYGLSWS